MGISRPSERPVTVALRNGVEALVAQGLKPREVVVIYPSDTLANGSRVTQASPTPGA